MDLRSSKKPTKEVYSSLDEMPDDERKALKESILEGTETYFRRTTTKPQQHELYVWDSWSHFYD